MRHSGAVTDPVRLFGPPATVDDGEVVVRVVAAYAIGMEVAVVVDALGLPRPDPERRPDPVIENVWVVRRDGTKTACTTRAGTSSAVSHHSVSWSQWLAVEVPEILALSIRTPTTSVIVTMSEIDLGDM
jgi:hypothetical protein